MYARKELSAIAIVELAGIKKRFDDGIVVHDISFSVELGEIFGLFGPNGAGKTTVISMISCLLTPGADTITVGGASAATPSAWLGLLS